MHDSISCSDIEGKYSSHWIKFDCMKLRTVETRRERNFRKEAEGPLNPVFWFKMIVDAADNETISPRLNQGPSWTAAGFFFDPDFRDREKCRC